MDAYVLSFLLSVGKLVNSVKYVNYELSTSEGRTLVALLNADVNTRTCAVLCSKFATQCDGFKLDSTSCALYAVKQTPSNERRGESVQMYLNSKLSPDPTAQRRDHSTNPRKTSTQEQNTFRSGEPSTSRSTESTTSSLTTTETSSVQSSSTTSISTKSPTMFGVPCKKDRECKYRHSQCIEGKCTCKIGSSFDFKHNTCVEKCTEYGTEFTKYKFRGVSGCSPESYEGVKNGYVCEELCTNSTKIVCINVEYSMWKKDCQLCDKAWVDIPDKYKEQDAFTTYTLHYRHCK